MLESADMSIPRHEVRAGVFALAMLPVRGSTGSGLLAIAVAAMVSSVFLWSGGNEHTPLLVASAAFLFLVVEEDLRLRRIPNWLTFSAFGAALAFAFWTQGWTGTQTAAVGAAVAFALLFPLFLFRVLGAGDVKALMVLGALWGAGTLVASLWWMLLAGGVVAIGVAGLAGHLPDILNRWRSSFLASVMTRRLTYFGPSTNDPASAHIPFGVAIALGAAAHRYWGIPWA